MSFITCILWLLLAALLGLLLGWLLWGRGRKEVVHVAGDMDINAEAELKAENAKLRARMGEMEVDASSLRAQLEDVAKGPYGSGTGYSKSEAADTSAADDTYALEWRNRYLAARVKYLEGRLTDAPAPVAKAAPAKKKAAPKKKAPAKKAAPKPQFRYDKPTDGKPDDLKMIKGIGQKLEKMLNDNGVYYFRQIGAWTKAQQNEINDILPTFKGRIFRDEWTKQAKVLAKGGATEFSKRAAKGEVASSAGGPRRKTAPKKK